MKNFSILRSLIGLMILLSIVNVAIAEDNFSISVSCSIPVVPGLNAPPWGEKTTDKDIIVTSNQDNEIENDTQEQKPSKIQENDTQEILLADGNTQSVITQTIYSR